MFVAPLGDRGHSKRLIMAGLLLGAVGSLLFATGSNLATFVVARGIIGSAFGFVFPAVRALIAHVDPERRGERLGRLGAVELLGFVAGPLIGGFLIDPVGLGETFALFGALNLVTLAVIARRSFPRLPSTEASQRLSFTLLREPKVRVAVLLFMATQAPIGVFDALWDRYLTDLGGTNVTVGLSFALFGLPYIALASRAGRFTDKRDSVKIAMAALVIVSPFLALYGLIEVLWFVVWLNFAEGIVQAMTYPAVNATIANSAPHGRAAAVQGLAGASGLLVALTMSVAMPPVYGAFGAGVTFTIVALLMLTCTGLAAVQHRRISGNGAVR
jgi:MFS family permease